MERADNMIHYSYKHAIESPILPDGVAYRMKVRIGTPPMETFVIMDTGSELMWIQCAPCEDCYPQQLPIFDPTRSTTYKNIPCGSFSSCPYNYSYGDSSMTRGVMGKELLTFTQPNNQPTTFTNVVFGCGHKNHGNFSPMASGIFGLGRGRVSLVSQIGSKLEKKFSYCLVERTSNTSSLFRMGKYASIPTHMYIFTPLLAKITHPNSYYLILEGISVGGIKIVNQKTLPKEGNIIIDFGTTLAYLDPELYLALEILVKERIRLEPEEYRLCYEGNTFNTTEDIRVTFHFQGVDIVLKNVNLFREHKDMTCLAMLPSKGDLNIYGNTTQINFYIEYDLRKEQISFVPIDCATYHEEVANHNDGQRLLTGPRFLCLIMLVLFSPI